MVLALLYELIRKCVFRASSFDTVEITFGATRVSLKPSAKTVKCQTAKSNLIFLVCCYLLGVSCVKSSSWTSLCLWIKFNLVAA